MFRFIFKSVFDGDTETEKHELWMCQCGNKRKVAIVRIDDENEIDEDDASAFSREFDSIDDAMPLYLHCVDEFGRGHFDWEGRKAEILNY